MPPDVTTKRAVQVILGRESDIGGGSATEIQILGKTGDERVPVHASGRSGTGCDATTTLR